jgi:hypothetical protein
VLELRGSLAAMERLRTLASEEARWFAQSWLVELDLARALHQQGDRAGALAQAEELLARVRRLLAERQALAGAQGERESRPLRELAGRLPRLFGELGMSERAEELGREFPMPDRRGR